ncbi:MAG: IPT/TIG domain-containing protein [Actinobacteria bacterium]|nr:IPT/TIG domain-containing protein [Actinomycetota bacterium]
MRTGVLGRILPAVCACTLIVFFLPVVTAIPLFRPGQESYAAATDGLVRAAVDDPTPPASPVKLIFIHHSCGSNWLSDSNGGLGVALRDANYFVSDTNYGWGPDDIGSSTDIGDWWSWFRGPSSATYTTALYAESGQNSSYSRLGSDPGGENEIIMFKSCYPNSAIGGSPTDPVPPIESNPLKGSSSPLTVANAKGIYIDILEYFETRLDKLFVVITAPPLRSSTYADNARAFNNWLVDDWLDGYPHDNVFVFDFYNVLTSNGGNPSASDFNWETGNHHRWLNGAIQHKTDGGGNTLAYASGDDHPNYVGNQKATGEFINLLNVAYNRFVDGGADAPSVASVSPSSGAVGTEVTIEGANLGDSRGSSYVAFESTQATQYTEWTDTRIRCLVPTGALSGWLRVVTEGGTSNVFNFVIPLPVVESSFLFAEGYTGGGFQEWLCLLNRDPDTAIAQITYLYADGSAPFTKDYPLPGDSRTTINVNEEVGADRDVSVKLESDGVILAERPMYFDYQGMWSGGHDVIGAAAPAGEWYFAEGYTGQGFDEWICVLNPGDEDATLTFRFQTQEAGEQVRKGYEVPARSRRTFKVNEVLGADYQASLAVESTSPIVAERPMYFDYMGTGAYHWEGGHCVMGATALSREYYFAEGTTRPGFEGWITLQNPNTYAITVDAEYQLGAGQGDPVQYVYEVAAGFRRTVFLPDEVGWNKDVSVKLSSDDGFLAERPMYFSYSTAGLNAQGGHCVIGATLPASEWLFAEGYTGGSFQEWLCLQNPEDTAAEVEITYYTQEAGVLPARQVAVPASTRVTLLVNQDAGPDYQLSTRVQVMSGPDIVAERPMYFVYGSGWDGGHDVVGYVPGE